MQERITYLERGVEINANKALIKHY